LVGLFGAVTEADIDREVQIIMRLCTTGHNHIVKVLHHDWLDSRYHFIDMELCDISLEEYVSGNPLLERPNLLHEPVFVSSDCSPNLRLLNTFTVGNHIAQGISFIHEQNYSHRVCAQSQVHAYVF
jgi:serine/threonine protein kinase